MVKTRILNSGLIREIVDYTACNDMVGRAIRISEANIGEIVLIPNEDPTRFVVVEILENISNPRPDADERGCIARTSGNRDTRKDTTFSGQVASPGRRNPRVR